MTRSDDSEVSMIRGFDPIIAPGARVLVLGTLPSAESLRKGQYYGNEQNAFWFIMGRLFGAGPDLGYETRCVRLTAAGVAVWDVLASAERQGSSDAAIVRSTATANDLAALLRANAQLEAVYFNGRASEDLFRAMVFPTLGERFRLALVRLPSTSPLNTHLTREAKVTAWEVIARRLAATS